MQLEKKRRKTTVFLKVHSTRNTYTGNKWDSPPPASTSSSTFHPRQGSYLLRNMAFLTYMRPIAETHVCLWTLRKPWHQKIKYFWKQLILLSSKVLELSHKQSSKSYRHGHMWPEVTRYPFKAHHYEIHETACLTRTVPVQKPLHVCLFDLQGTISNSLWDV